MSAKQREERFYKTGDYVSVDHDGTVHFLGRVDRQVKVNGYRVELEHIESVLRRVEGVHDTAVFHLEVHGKHRLVAAVLRRPGGDVSPEVLTARLETLLPEYMIPRTFLGVDEFPRNDNGKTDLKKLREVVIGRLAEKRDAEPVSSTLVVDQSALAQEIRELWTRHLRDRSFGDDDSFFTLGGDSLEAIQVIAELQIRGYDVTAHAFLSQPTVRGLMHAIAAAPGLTAGAGASDAQALQQSRALTCAQDFFFRQQLPQPDHYNQAILLECASRVNVDALREAVRQVLATHPALSTAYAPDEAGLVARLTSAPEDALSASTLSPELDEAGVQKEIDEVSERVHRSISLSAGRLFRAHMFERPGAHDQLLLVAHHVAVDVISWRIIVGDLVRVYCERLAGRSSTLFRSRTMLWGWVDHLESSRDALIRESEPWLSKAREARERGKIAYDDLNTEGASRTAWFGFSSEQTQRLASKLSAAFGAPLHQALLGTFAYCYGRERGLGQLTVDVESHGRVTLDGSVDVSRLVGWHTSTFPLDIELGDGSLAQAIRIAGGLRDIPHLGAAFGLAGEKDGSRVASPSSSVCYNYLGEINLGHDERFALRKSPYTMVSARGEQNNRLYELKLTGRVIDGHFIVDLSFPAAAEARSTSLMRSIQATLSELAGVSSGVADLVVEEGSRTGLLTHVPARLLSDAPPAAAKEYRAVFLTGATGFVGAHVLRELFSRSQAQVYCLVRAKDGTGPEERLRRAYDAYFPEAPLAGFAERYTVLEGDASQERLGLTEEAYAQLSSTVEAIYHFAAETKLFGQEEEFRRHNVMSVQSCVDLAGRTRPKDMHYMSTLAVSGINPRQEPVDFSEDSMDVGQEFQNFYESTKFAAEGVARSAEASGCRVFIYRSGNVSGDSQTARFQTNARDNRFVQFLAACSKLAKLPTDLGSPIVLSPIDEVAAGIVAISLDPSISGGVFHVDSSFAVPMDRVFHAMRQHGLVLEDTRHSSFASLFAEARDRHRQDPEVVLGHFWASRKPRNVRYDNERTHQLLGRLGRSFSHLDDVWLSKFIRQLVSSGVLTVTPTRPTHGGDCLAAENQAQ